MAEPIRLGLVQLDAERLDAAAARERATEAAASALAAGADLVVLPELAVPGYLGDAEALAAGAESLGGPTVTGWQQLVAGTGKVVVGGFCERAGEGVYNAVAVVSDAGVIGHYRKLHLFGGERKLFLPGDGGLPVVDTPLGRVGICVCYDLRFVEVTRILALQGAQVVAVPTAWVPGFDTEWWGPDGLCPQARSAGVLANLNQVFVACASFAGAREDLTFLGSSVVFGPHGDLRTGPLPGAGAATTIATVDLDDTAAALARGGTLASPRADRRTDVYTLGYAGREW